MILKIIGDTAHNYNQLIRHQFYLLLVSRLPLLLVFTLQPQIVVYKTKLRTDQTMKLLKIQLCAKDFTSSVIFQDVCVLPFKNACVNSLLKKNNQGEWQSPRLSCKLKVIFLDSHQGHSSTFPQ